MSGESNNGKSFVRKTSCKNRKPPEVKQTLTSKYRLLKANPLLMTALASSQEDKEKILLNKPLKRLATALGNSSEILNGKLPLVNGSTAGNSREPKMLKKQDNANSNVKIFPKPKTSFNNSNLSKIVFTSDKILSSTIIESRRKSSIKNFKTHLNHKITNVSTPRPMLSKNKQLLPQLSGNRSMKQDNGLKPSIPNSKASLSNKSSSLITSSTQTKPKNNLQSNHKPTADKKQNIRTNEAKYSQKPLRRSLSSEHFDSKKKELMKQHVQRKRSQSFEELRNNGIIEENISTITEEYSFTTSQEAPTPKFKTPMAYNRSSIKTPNTTSNRRSLFLSTPNRNEMSERLNEWLIRTGKKLEDFHHLKCFGVHGNGNKIVTKVVTENKENIQHNPCNQNYEDLSIKVSNGIKNKVENFPASVNVDLEIVAKEALQDLHNLILEGYTCEQCESWLKLIKQKCPKLEKDPQYWECRAALEQTRGNINLAVECYKTAIVEGAEIQSVDKSLDQLLQKFSLLNINSQDANKTETKDRMKIIKDARKIFKYSIIQFAVQERILKKKDKEGVTIEKKLIATPVRRSTRLSRSAYTCTPGVKIYSSLKEVDSDIKDSINFVYNKALND